ncbi:ATP synthase subunit d, mitochondrial-like [Maniola jurtina]|uniref:ATP synthase subunit d, mitochondrial-like n=1 Tax=Maniola jurtina TaxID=191418 RepID=UPI001E68DA37|nr:ATP synthase subunit d, mitochondrial-like [Maniola jurtina]
MSKRFTKPAINWIEFEKRVPPEQKGKFLAFKAKADMYLRRMQAFPPELPKINWEEYAKKVPVQGLVEKFKSEYAQVKIPYPVDTLSVKVDEQWKSLQPQIKSYCADRQKEIDAAQKELDKINALPKFDDITLEMLYDMNGVKAFDPVKRPTFWPHTPEEQPGYMTPEQKALKEKKH